MTQGSPKKQNQQDLCGGGGRGGVDVYPCVYTYIERLIYYRKLSHTIMEAEKSQGVQWLS